MEKGNSSKQITIVCPKCKQQMLWDSNFDLEDDDGTHHGVQSTYHCRNKNCDVQEVYIHTNSYYDED